MGNAYSYCTECNVQLSGPGNMCIRCYDKKHPRCSSCSGYIYRGDKKICGMHEICYNKKHPRCSRCGADIYPGDKKIYGMHEICFCDEYRRCYTCHGSVGNSPSNSYCTGCYNRMNPPERVLYVRQGNSVVEMYSRYDVKDLLPYLGNGFSRALMDGRKGKGGLAALDTE